MILLFYWNKNNLNNWLSNKYPRLMHHLLKNLRFNISLFSLKNENKKSRQMIVHHGLMGSSKNFRTICKHPSISDYVNTHLIDCRNHGSSPPMPTHTMEDLADDLFEYISNEREIGNESWNRIVLMGHSMGALALMALTKKYPQLQDMVERVILIDITAQRLGDDAGFHKTANMLKKMATINLKQKTAAIYKQIDEYANSIQAAGLIKSNLIYEEGEEHRWLPNLEVIVNNLDQIGNFSLGTTEWKKPVEVIYGSESPYVNAEQIELFCEAYPTMNHNDNFHRVDGAGHWVHFDRTKEFLKVMEKILRKDN